jgi:hypothetical protein
MFPSSRDVLEQRVVFSVGRFAAAMAGNGYHGPAPLLED